MTPVRTVQQPTNSQPFKSQKLESALTIIAGLALMGVAGTGLNGIFYPHLFNQSIVAIVVGTIGGGACLAKGINMYPRPS